MKAQEYKPCPICHGINSDNCECCRGVGRFPYPWILPEDKSIRKRWTEYEDEVVYSAVSAVDAYRRYACVFGSTERSASSVYRHWQYSHKTKTTQPFWTDAETAVICTGTNSTHAAYLYFEAYGMQRTPRAVKAKYYRTRYTSSK